MKGGEGDGQQAKNQKPGLGLWKNTDDELSALSYDVLS